jgi:hypothetical protein
MHFVIYFNENGMVLHPYSGQKNNVMRTGLILAAFGTGLILLASSGKAKDLSKTLVDSTGELRGKLAKLFKSMGSEMGKLQKIVGKQMCSMTKAVKNKVITE